MTSRYYHYGKFSSRENTVPRALNAKEPKTRGIHLLIMHGIHMLWNSSIETHGIHLLRHMAFICYDTWHSFQAPLGTSSAHFQVTHVTLFL
jgi:hypothetical protein